jgi:hypothetical protein
MNPYNYSCLRLQAAATSRSHQIDRKFTLDCKLDETATQTGVFYRKKPLEVYNAVIPRFGPTVTGHGTLILEQLENRNIPSLNSAEAIRNVRNKKQFLRIRLQLQVAFFRKILNLKLCLLRRWVVSLQSSNVRTVPAGKAYISWNAKTSFEQ